MSSTSTGLGLVQHDPATGKVTIIRSDNRTGTFIHLALARSEVDALRAALAPSDPATDTGGEGHG